MQRRPYVDKAARHGCSLLSCVRETTLQLVLGGVVLSSTTVSPERVAAPRKHGMCCVNAPTAMWSVHTATPAAHSSRRKWRPLSLVVVLVIGSNYRHMHARHVQQPRRMYPLPLCSIETVPLSSPFAAHAPTHSPSNSRGLYSSPLRGVMGGGFLSGQLTTCRAVDPNHRWGASM